MTERTVLCVDLDAFFASVEQATRPELRGKPVVVGGVDGRRGVVTAASYEARPFGVRSAMPMVQARRLCPQAIFVQARFDLYVATSERVMELLRRFSPMVEQASLDEAYLDYTGCEALLGPPRAGAEKLRAALRSELGLPASVGIAPGKLVAKVASARAKPDGVVEVLPGEEAAWLAPMPVGAIPGVGPAAQARLGALGCRTIRELQELPEGVLVRNLGDAMGAWLAEARFGRDGSPVVTDRSARSLGHENTFESDIEEESQLLAELRVLTERAGYRLRQLELEAATVTIKLRYSNFETVSRARTLEAPTALDSELAQAASDLFRKHWTGRAVRLLGVSLSGLRPREAQAGLFEDPEARALQESLDELKRRFGGRAVYRAATTFAGHDRSASAGAGLRHTPATPAPPNGEPGETDEEHPDPEESP
ncbi:MAG: DNA polymerase IV [Candidatus Dormibacteria bacterium]